MPTNLKPSITTQPSQFEELLLKRHYLEGVGEAIIPLSPDGVIRGWSKASQLMFGYQPNEAIGSPISTIFSSEDLALQIDLFEREAAAQNELAEDDRWHVRKDGTRIWVTGTLNSVRDEGGVLLGFVKILRDRTDLRTKLEKLENEVASATATALHESHFLQTIGHEMRNPLGPLAMAVELLKHENASPKTIGIIHRQVTALKSLAGNLMDLERMRQGGLQLAVETFDLQRLLEGALEDLRPKADMKNVGWKSVMQQVPLILTADPSRLAQVVANLLSNALRYTPSGGTVILKAVQEVDEAVIRVEDSGIGISAQLLPQLFQFFSRGHEAKGIVPDGLGVGLALCREIVGLHGGTIAARSPGPGHGSEFIVRVPLQQATGD